MKKKKIQDYLDNLWGTLLTDLQMDLQNDTLTFNIEIHENDRINFQTVKFVDVSCFYYVKDSVKNRFDFYDRDKGYYLELTTIDHVERNKYDFKIKLTSDAEWKNTQLLRMSSSKSGTPS